MKFLINALATAVFVVMIANTMPPTKPYFIYAPSTEEPTQQLQGENPITLSGVATWYDARKNNAWYTREGGGLAQNQQDGPYQFYGAAGPKLRLYHDFNYGMKPYMVLVTSIRTGRSVAVWVVDWCDCHGKKATGDERLIDLAPAVWDALGVNTALGVMKIRLTILDNLEDPR